MLLSENARRQHRPKLMKELEAVLDTKPARDDFLSLEGAEALQAAVVDQARYHLVFHRIWGDRLAGEVTMALRTLGDRLEGDHAYVILCDPLEAVRIPVGPLLRHTAAHLSRDTDVTLVTGEADSGLVLTWDHLPNADEYSLLTWGRFAFDLSP
jgi:hypothetical protein